MFRTFLAALCLAIAVPAFAASDPDDAEGMKDHPDIPRFPGYWLVSGDVTDFNAHEFTLAVDDTNGEKLQSVEGRYWNLHYGLKEDAKRPSALAVFRNYENAFKAKGGAVVWKVLEEGWAKATFKMPLGKSERWMQLEIHDNGGSYELIIVEVAKMEQQIELSASEMKEQLDKNGFVALYGIQFDTGKASIKAESEPLLAEIAKLLADENGLELSVEGHTDNVGNKKSNEKLSKQRAESVKKWLVAKGTEGKRLAAAGFGDARPVADNRTEEGRAKNRRVELVKK